MGAKTICSDRFVAGGNRRDERAILIASVVSPWFAWLALALQLLTVCNATTQYGRWLLSSMVLRSLFHAFGFVFDSSQLPPELALSDGGHFENLGILPLFQRECDKIIAVDAGSDAAPTAPPNH